MELPLIAINKELNELNCFCVIKTNTGTVNWLQYCYQFYFFFVNWSLFDNIVMVVFQIIFHVKKSMIFFYFLKIIF